MMVVRLAHWVFRRKVIRCWIDGCPSCGLKKDPRAVWDPYDRCPRCNRHIPPTHRAPTFLEAVTGISN